MNRILVEFTTILTMIFFHTLKPYPYKGQTNLTVKLKLVTVKSHDSGIIIAVRLVLKLYQLKFMLVSMLIIKEGVQLASHEV